MKDSYKLVDSPFVSPSPAGAYFCASDNKDIPARRLLQLLMKKKSTSTVTLMMVELMATVGVNRKELFSLLYRMQTLGWLEGSEKKRKVPEGELEDMLPRLLMELSESGQALLADEQGSHVSSQGFTLKVADELSALSADILSVYESHKSLLRKDLSLNTAAWSMIDSAGNGQICFWPLWIGKHRFVLVIKGEALLNQAALIQLIWLLSIKYSSVKK